MNFMFECQKNNIYISRISVFDDFPKIRNHFPKVSKNLKFLKTTENFQNYRRLPKTFEEDPKMFRSYTNEFKCNLNKGQK